MSDHYALWCAANGCRHGHCPYGHEHPQPFGVVMRGETAVRLICGRCWCMDEVISEMLPCTSEVCA